MLGRGEVGPEGFGHLLAAGYSGSYKWIRTEFGISEDVAASSPSGSRYSPRQSRAHSVPGAVLTP